MPGRVAAAVVVRRVCHFPGDRRHPVLALVVVVLTLCLTCRRRLSSIGRSRDVARGEKISVLREEKDRRDQQVGQ